MNKKPNHVLDNVEGFCGPYPSDFIDIDISNDPSFIFQNDIEYDAVKLYDSDGNSVIVNSFFECHHYVKGGWDATPNLINESFFHNSLFVFSLLSIFLGYIAIKKFFRRGTI